MTKEFILIGLVLMIFISLFQIKISKLSIFKSILLSIFLVVFGVTGAVILAYIENGNWGGISFYGSVLLIPVLLPIVSILLKEKYTKLLDLSVPQICIMLFAMKINCHISGCCGGKLLYISKSGSEIFFPSQIVESIIALILAIIFIGLINKRKMKNNIYPLFFIVYGTTRLILNFFRNVKENFIWIIPAGHFWSIISILIGFVFIVKYYLKEDL